MNQRPGSPPAVIPDDLRRFILTSVPSIPYLEAALLIRSRPTKMWSAFDLSRALYMREAHGAELLAELRDAGVIEPATQCDGYRYAPRDDALQQRLDRLAELYQLNLVAVTQLVHDNTGRAAQRFADAFNIRKIS